MLKRKIKKEWTLIGVANTITIMIIILATVTAQMGETAMFRKVLFAFHMPLFFMLSGITLVKHKGEGKEGWLSFLRNMLLSFIMPYTLWALVYAAFSYKNLIWIVYGSWEALSKAQTLPILWFLPCMFVARILVEGVLFIVPKMPVNKRIGILLFTVLSLVIGVILPKTGGLSYPWCADAAFSAAGFMLLGYLIREWLEIIAKKPSFTIGMFIASLALFLAGTVARGENLEMVFMRSRDYGNLFWFFLNALSSCLVVLSISALISHNWTKNTPLISELDEAGINRVTMGIFVIQMPLLQQVILPLIGLLPFMMPKAVMFLIAVVLTKQNSGLIIRVFARNVPQLFGIYPALERE